MVPSSLKEFKDCVLCNHLVHFLGHKHLKYKKILKVIYSIPTQGIHAHQNVPAGWVAHALPYCHVGQLGRISLMRLDYEILATE